MLNRYAHNFKNLPNDVCEKVIEWVDPFEKFIVADVSHKCRTMIYGCDTLPPMYEEGLTSMDLIYYYRRRRSKRLLAKLANGRDTFAVYQSLKYNPRGGRRPYNTYLSRLPELLFNKDEYSHELEYRFRADSIRRGLRENNRGIIEHFKTLKIKLLMEDIEYVIETNNIEILNFLLDKHHKAVLLDLNNKPYLFARACANSSHYMIPALLVYSSSGYYIDRETSILTCPSIEIWNLTDSTPDKYSEFERAQIPLTIVHHFRLGSEIARFIQEINNINTKEDMTTNSTMVLELIMDTRPSCLIALLQVNNIIIGAYMYEMLLMDNGPLMKTIKSNRVDPVVLKFNYTYMKMNCITHMFDNKKHIIPCNGISMEDAVSMDQEAYSFCISNEIFLDPILALLLFKSGINVPSNRQGLALLMKS